MPTYQENRPQCVFDLETYIDYFSAGFKSVDDGRTKVFEMYEGQPLDKKGIATICRKWQLIGFNSIAFDIPILLYAMSGATTEELKLAATDLIECGVPHWTFMERHGLKVPEFLDHIDLWSVSPGIPQRPSLKIYAGRLHSKKMQELPIAHDETLGEQGRQIIRAYHGNDLDVTIDMANELKAQLELRVLMSRQYGVDLRSKSDAQIAEAVIRTEMEKILGRKFYRQEIVPGHFGYDAPPFIRFRTQQMREVLNRLRSVKFVVDAKGIVHAPDYLTNLQISIGQSVHRMGLGGLHSSEKRQSHYSDDEFVLLDRDVTSYYPNVILALGLYPKQLGPKFLDVYRGILSRRIAAKKAGDKNTAESLKIVANSNFGHFGNPYSAVLYSPKLMIQTTITGQLSLLMLIEDLECRDFSVVSSNTDGFVTKVQRSRRNEYNAVCLDWELTTGFMLEETEYRSLHSKSVNGYIAIAENGKVKLKGDIGLSGPGLPGAAGLKKNPDMDICTDAVVEYLTKGTPIEDTIEWCVDPRKFLTVRRVTGGAMDQDGQPIGKALRWYYSREVSGGFTYAKNGNAVPQTIGARTMMTLLPYIPSDLDYDYYIREAYAILQDLGVRVDDPKLRGRTGTLYGRLPDQKTYHIVDAETGIALCGKERASIRDSWVEVGTAPEGRALCKKCKDKQ